MSMYMETDNSLDPDHMGSLTVKSGHDYHQKSLRTL